MTCTFLILTSTNITELITTSACHMVTALILFNPKLAFGTLFCLYYILNHVYNFAIIWIIHFINFKFCTRHSIVHFNSTIKTVSHMTFFTKNLTLGFNKSIATWRSRTPRHILCCINISRKLHLFQFFKLLHSHYILKISVK